MIVTFEQPHLIPLGPSGEWELEDRWTVTIQGREGRYPFVFEEAVPAGFVHDRASIPWFLMSFVSKDSLGAAGSLLHDWLYGEHTTTRAVADRYFRVVMAADGVKRWRRNLAWVAVRVGGFLAWRKSFRKR